MHERASVVDALGNCLHLVLTPGQSADSPQLPVLLAALPQPPGAVVADKAYDTNQVLDTVARHEAEAVIPPKTSRLDQRGFATRYEKTATCFLAVTHLLAVLNWMR